MSSRILITGGFGYLGGRIAQDLSCLEKVNIILGTRRNREVPNWLTSASVTTIDWNDTTTLRTACAGVDSVIHLAAMNEIDSSNDPAGALEMNGVYTARLLEAAKYEGVKRFLYFSTAHVYAAPLIGDIDESMCPKPIHPYATSHRAAEDVVLAAHEKKEISAVVIRLSNSYGAPTHSDIDRWTLLVNDLCVQAVTSRELKLKTPGLQRRDFVPISNVCDAVRHLLRLPDEKLGNGVFNVGGMWSPTIFDMAILIAERCKAVLGYKPEIIRPEPPIDEQKEYLEYKIDKLLGTGFELIDNKFEEIDATLKFCHESFVK